MLPLITQGKVKKYNAWRRYLKSVGARYLTAVTVKHTVKDVTLCRLHASALEWGIRFPRIKDIKRPCNSKLATQILQHNLFFFINFKIAHNRLENTPQYVKLKVFKIKVVLDFTYDLSFNHRKPKTGKKFGSFVLRISLRVYQLIV